MNKCQHCGRGIESGDLCDTCKAMFDVIEDPESYTSLKVRVNYD